MGTIKNRNGRDLVDAEEYKKRYKNCRKTDINEPDNYDGVVSHPEPDILECKVKWDSGSTVFNKASGCDGIPVQLFKTLKDDAIKVLHSICQQSGRPSSGHKTGKGQSSAQFPRRVVIKNIQTIRQLHASKAMLKNLHARIQH